MRIALLSIEDLSDFVADDELLLEPLRRLGHVAEFVPWQAAVEWRNYDGVVIRTTWDYQHHLPAFLAVLQDIETQTRLANPLEIVKWNADKKIYLQDIEKRGGKIVPTIWSNNGIDSRQIQEWFEQFQTEEIVRRQRCVNLHRVDKMTRRLCYQIVWLKWAVRCWRRLQAAEQPARAIHGTILALAVQQQSREIEPPVEGVRLFVTPRDVDRDRRDRLPPEQMDLQSSTRMA